MTVTHHLYTKKYGVEGWTLDNVYKWHDLKNFKRNAWNASKQKSFKVCYCKDSCQEIFITPEEFLLMPLWNLEQKESSPYLVVSLIHGYVKKQDLNSYLDKLDLISRNYDGQFLEMDKDRYLLTVSFFKEGEKALPKGVNKINIYSKEEQAEYKEEQRKKNLKELGLEE